MSYNRDQLLYCCNLVAVAALARHVDVIQYLASEILSSTFVDVVAQPASEVRMCIGMQSFMHQNRRIAMIGGVVDYGVIWGRVFQLLAVLSQIGSSWAEAIWLGGSGPVSVSPTRVEQSWGFWGCRQRNFIQSSA